MKTGNEIYNNLMQMHAAAVRAVEENATRVSILAMQAHAYLDRNEKADTTEPANEDAEKNPGE